VVALPSPVVRLSSRAPDDDLTVPVTLRQLPRPVNLVTYRGDDFAFALTVWNSDGTAADLSGGTFAAQVRATADSTDELGTLAVTVTDNNVDLHLANTTSAALPRSAVWDVEMTDAGWVTTLAAGTLVTTADVTRLS
jgi:hypothetical protein